MVPPNAPTPTISVWILKPPRWQMARPSRPSDSFFESALKASGYCNGYGICTATVLDQEGPNGTGNLQFQQVWSL
jgi:hypothetical protein